MTEDKAIWFFKKNVLGRELRQCRYLTSRTDAEGRIIKQTVGKSVIHNYKSALVDLWSFQKSSGVNPHSHPCGEALKAVIRAHASQEHVRKRTQFDDRGAGTLQDGYNEKGIVDVVRHCWTGWQDHRARSPEAYLRTGLDFLLGHSMLL